MVGHPQQTLEVDLVVREHCDEVRQLQARQKQLQVAIAEDLSVGRSGVLKHILCGQYLQFEKCIFFFNVYFFSCMQLDLFYIPSLLYLPCVNSEKCSSGSRPMAICRCAFC